MEGQPCLLSIFVLLQATLHVLFVARVLEQLGLVSPIQTHALSKAYAICWVLTSAFSPLMVQSCLVFRSLSDCLGAFVPHTEQLLRSEALGGVTCFCRRWLLQLGVVVDLGYDAYCKVDTEPRCLAAG